MNFAQMLAMDVKPLPDTRPDQPKKFKGNTDLRPAHKKRMATARDAYKKAIGKGWTHTRTIERRMGMGLSSAYKTLMRYAEMGLIERRPLGDGPWNQRKGGEWRWIG